MAPKRKKKKKYRLFWLFAKIQLALFLLVAGVCGYYFFGGYAKEVKELEREAQRMVRESTEETFRGGQGSVIYAADGSVISEFKGEKDTFYLRRENIPGNVIAAFISIEDKKFYQHDGVDYRALLRAGKALVENGKVTQGGSTITMQLARNVFISQERTWQRKVQEMYIAWNLEKKYTKDQILEFYVNSIYFGNGYYGIQAASRGYFNRDVGELSLSQAAFLCAIPNNPTKYDPLTGMEDTLARRDRILLNMKQDGKITQNSYEEAVAETITLERPEGRQEKNVYVETYAWYCAARVLMEQKGFVFRYEFASEKEEETYREAYDTLYEICQEQMHTEGYQIYTSLDFQLQSELQASVDDVLFDFTEQNEEGIYALQASAVCIDNQNGCVRAIVGGRSQDISGYTLNRAYQSFRQPGSAIKPLTVYTPSFERSYTPDSMVVDEPIEDGPRNANGKYAGEVTLRRAVESSINTIAWKLYVELTPETGLSYLEKMDFSKLDVEDYRPASALGGFTNGVSALEMASGYAALANDGRFRTPSCIVKIVDAGGEEIYVRAEAGEEVYRQNAARTMTDVLRGVFTNGTGKGLGLKTMPCAGKTGTTNENKDGWFVGYTRYYTTSVWVGYDMPRPMDDLMGSTYPGKIWKGFMEKAHEGLEPLDFLPYAQLSEGFGETDQPGGGAAADQPSSGAEEEEPLPGGGAAADQPASGAGEDEPLPGGGAAADQPGERISDGDMTGN